MTIVRDPVHNFVHKPVDNPRVPGPAARSRREPVPPRYHYRAEGGLVDIYVPKLDIRIDQTFWHNRSFLAGTQEQLDELRREADARAAARARAEYARQWEAEHARRAAAERRVLVAHRPVFKRLKPIVLVGLVPMLWAITTCQCGERWPCNDIKQYLRRRIGWTVGIDEPLKELAGKMPKPATRWTRFKRWLTRRNNDSDRSRWDERDR